MKNLSLAFALICFAPVGAMAFSFSLQHLTYPPEPVVQAPAPCDPAPTVEICIAAPK